MQMERIWTIKTDQVICINVAIINITKESVTVKDAEGRELELDADAITSVY